MVRVDLQRSRGTYPFIRKTPVIIDTRLGIYPVNVDGSNMEFINITDPPYNATGDGVTDETSIILSAISDAYDAGGGVVFFPVGQYLISSPLVVKAGVHLMGVGTASEILSRLTLSNQACIQFSSSINRGGLKDMKISGDSSNKVGIGVDFTDSLFNHVTNIEIWDFEVGVLLSGSSGHSSHNSIDQYEVNRCPIGIKAWISANSNTLGRGRIFWSFDDSNGGIGLDIDTATVLKIGTLDIESCDLAVRIRGKSNIGIRDIYIEPGTNSCEAEIGGNDDGLYRIVYTDRYYNSSSNADYNASGNTIEEIRDGLSSSLAGLGTGTTFSKSGTDTILGSGGTCVLSASAPSSNISLVNRGDRRGWDVRPDFSTTGSSLSSPRISVQNSYDGFSQSNAVWGEPEEVMDFSAISQVYFGAHKHFAAITQGGAVDNGELYQISGTDIPNWYFVGAVAPSINEKSGSGEWETGGKSLELINDGSTTNQGIAGRFRIPGRMEYATVNFRFQSPSVSGSDLPFFSVSAGSNSANWSDVDSRITKGIWRTASVTVHRDHDNETEPGEIGFTAIADASVKGGRIWLDRVWANPGRVATPHQQSGQRIVMLEKPQIVTESLGGTANKGPMSLAMNWSGSGPAFNLSTEITGGLARPPDGAIGAIMSGHIKIHTGSGIGSSELIPSGSYFYWNPPYEASKSEALRIPAPYADAFYGSQFVVRRVESTKTITFGTINQSGNNHDMRVVILGWLLPS